MEENKRGIVGHKGLLATLIILIIAIVGLIAGVIVVSNRPKDGGSSGEIVLEEEEGFREEDDLEVTIENAEKLVENNEVDKMKTLYAARLEQLIEEGMEETALLEFILSEEVILYEAGYKEDALGVLLDVDCDMFKRPMNQYVCLSQTHILAEELNRKDVTDDYDVKLKELGERTGVVIYE